MKRPELWGHLRERYQETRPRKILSIDGGGIRVLIGLGILERIEEVVTAGSGARLCDYFDYIGGTSTGAIVAAGLARGLSVSELRSFFVRMGPAMFTKSALLARFKSLYTSDPLKRELQELFGNDTTLEPRHLRSLLLVVTQNLTTGSPWPISSNPEAKYNDPARKDSNLRIPIWQLVRASTAAPGYFPPEVVQWDPYDPAKTFVFADGSLTPYNNPAFLLYRMAVQPEYQLGWAGGEKNLLIVSVGAGHNPNPEYSADPAQQSLLGSINLTLGSISSSVQREQDLVCRTVGRCTYGEVLDREILDLIPRELSEAAKPPIPLSRDLGRQFLYARYDAELTSAGLQQLGLTPADDLAAIRQFDNVTAGNLERLVEIGEAAGRRVSPDHFGCFAERALTV